MNKKWMFLILSCSLASSLIAMEEINGEEVGPEEATRESVDCKKKLFGLPESCLKPAVCALLTQTFMLGYVSSIACDKYYCQDECVPQKMIGHVSLLASLITTGYASFALKRARKSGEILKEDAFDAAKCLFVPGVLWVSLENWVKEKTKTD